MELSVLVNGENLDIKQAITESDQNFSHRLKFILSALDLGIRPERSKILSLCFLNRILFGSVYSSDLEAEINRIASQIENDQTPS